MSFYAVANGRTNGIFLNWNDCNNSVKGYKNALYKKFDTEIEAHKFITLNEKNIEHNSNTKIQKQNDTSSLFHKIKSIQDDNITDFNADYYVYTDGACSNNGKHNAFAGIGIFFGTNDNRNVSKTIEGKQTNNTAELSAIIETYYIIENDIKQGKNIAIVSDSKYAINCATSYGEKCYKNNWDVDIPNKTLVKTLYTLYKNKPNIQFIHIKAHTNKTDNHSIGNEHADRLANLAIGVEKCPYDKPKKIYLNVPFIEKDEIKKLGGKWDRNKKKWFVYNDNKNIEKILTSFLK